MVVLSAHDKLSISDVPHDILAKNPSEKGGVSLGNTGNLREVEKELIGQKLARFKGNKSKAAKELGISRRTLYRKMEEYKL